MIKITKWKPDTCDCELEYSWDDTKSEDVRTHTIANIIKDCPAHKGLGKVDHYANVLNENQRKNKVFGEIIENISTAVETFIDEDGNESKRLKKGKEYKWSFDENRNLVIDLVGFTDLEKQAVKSITDTKFPNKVTQK